MNRPSFFRPLATVAAACLAILALAAPLSGAGETSSEPRKPLYWPEQNRPKLTYRTVERFFDNYPVRIGMLSGSGFDLVTGIENSWEPLVATPARFSIAFRYRSAPDLAFAATVFTPEEFMKDLSAATWGRYVDGLRETCGADFRLLEEKSSVEDPAAGATVMDEPTREITFVRKVAATNVIAEANLFLLKKGKLLAFTLIGPEKLVAAHVEEFRLMLVQFGEQTSR